MSDTVLAGVRDIEAHGSSFWVTELGKHQDGQFQAKLVSPVQSIAPGEKHSRGHYCAQT
jgi:hypothetical protein